MNIIQSYLHDIDRPLTWLAKKIIGINYKRLYRLSRSQNNRILFENMTVAEAKAISKQIPTLEERILKDMSAADPNHRNWRDLQQAEAY